MKKRTYTILLILVLVAGFILLLYPTVSNYINVTNSVKAVEIYNQKTSEIETATNVKYFDEAEKYNLNIANDILPMNYSSKLDVTGDGMMGYISIPKINVVLPIYHGTDDSILSFAAGHIEGTSLPVGGNSTHSVITGHRGLPSAKLFTDLDEMEVGDTFSVTVLNEAFTYEVDQIIVVKPEEVSYLEVIEGRDLMTLVTCTPYGINTHRLLVRGTRVETEQHVMADAMKIDVTDTILMVVLPLLAVSAVFVVVLKKRGKKK